MTGETILSIITGIALSAACGFRVFVPMLVMSIASYSGPPLSLPSSLEWINSLTGHLSLAPGFQWISSAIAVKALALLLCVKSPPITFRGLTIFSTTSHPPPLSSQEFW